MDEQPAEPLTPEQEAALELERRILADRRALNRAKRDVRSSLRRDGLLESADPLLVEAAARALARVRQFAALIAELDPSLLAETSRGTSVHPYIGHERELRGELRLHLAAIRGPKAAEPTKRKRADSASIAGTLGAPRRALEVVGGSNS